MNWAVECAAVIPCLNEEAAIASVVAGVRRYLPTIFVVDDGSTDRTAKLAAEAGAEVLRHESPRGKGAAVQTGWQCARARGFQWALTLDGDGQHSSQDIVTSLQSAEQTATPSIVGNGL